MIITSDVLVPGHFIDRQNNRQTFANTVESSEKQTRQE